MIRRYISLSAITVLLSLFALSRPTFGASDNLTFKEYLEQANSYIKAYRHFEAAEALKKATKLGGETHPSLHMRLAILYYGLGLIPEAIEEGRQAAALAPASKWYKYDLAKFYYVDKQYDLAEQQFNALLKLDPGFTLGYYYLGELYVRKHEYDLAWLCLQRARKLGLDGKHLESKIAKSSSHPQENVKISAEDNALFRFIKLANHRQAEQTLKEIRGGKLFENLELEMKKEENKADFGVMMLNELKDSVADSLRDSPPYGTPMLVQTGPDYRIMQRILPFNPAAWKALALVRPAPDAQEPEIAKVSSPQPVPRPAAQPQHIDPQDTPPQAISTQAPLSKTSIKTAKQGVKLAVLSVIDGWKKAWESKNLSRYFDCYSKRFTPEDGLSSEKWREQRAKNISGPKKISIKISDQAVESLGDDQLLITFKQEYQAKSYRDLVVKTMTMQKEGATWKIVAERVVKKL